MRRTLALILAFGLWMSLSQGVSAAAIADGDETSDHTMVRLWITDGKNLPDTNENNPVLSVRVIDEQGNLIPNAMVTLHLVQPVLSDELVIKSDPNGSTTPDQGNPAAAVHYKVFGPNNPDILYLVRANAQGYIEGVTPPFTIDFEESGTIEVQLLKRDSHTDLRVTYVVRDQDQANLAFTQTNVKKGHSIGVVNVPRVTVPNTNSNQWKFIGYFIHNQKYTVEELGNFVPTEDTIVEIRSMPDYNNDGKDDRDKDPGAIHPEDPNKSSENGKGLVQSLVKTGDENYSIRYAVGLGISLILLIWSFKIFRKYKKRDNVWHG
ncbi:MAG: hypothetical protein RR071_00780 [Lachnospiraceae bacterium]